MTIHHRTEIDGVRAVAVVPVILAHAGFASVSGGFVGVDVFFVISGYLITSIILRETQQGTFSVAKFYERRARRILPALLFVSFVTFISAFVTLAPIDLRDFGRSLVAVSAFASNLYFWLTGGYFDTASALKPMLHTWSLAIEEQYYIAFPLLALLFAKFWGRSEFLIAVCILTALSFGFCVYAVRSEAISAYFLLQYRAWELGVGSIMAFFPPCPPASDRQKRLHARLALVGLCSLISAVALYSDSTPFPSEYTLIPVIGTVLILRYAWPSNVVGQLLRTKLLVGVGLISYSLYLWHQPVLAGYRLVFERHVTFGHRLLLVALIFALATLTWRFVETPFRHGAFATRKVILTFSSIGLFLLAGVGFATHQSNGFAAQRLNPMQREILATVQHSPEQKRCYTIGQNYVPPDKSCVFGDPNAQTWVVFGDSHGSELAYMLAQALTPRGVSVRQMTFGGCHPTASATAHKACSAWTAAAIKHLAQMDNVSTIVLAYRYKQHAAVEGLRPNRGESHEKSSRHSYDFTASFSALVQALQPDKRRIIVVRDAPELPDHVQRLVTREPIEGGTITGFLRAGLPRWQHAWTVTQGAAGASATMIDTSSVFCTDEQCFAARQGEALYYDDNHMSLAAARHVAGQLLSKIPIDSAR